MWWPEAEEEAEEGLWFVVLARADREEDDIGVLGLCSGWGEGRDSVWTVAIH
jgi:hypothetical protein